MLKHLIVLLDDTSVSFCHHDNMKTDRFPMPLTILKEGIKFGMMENLRIQFVLPDYPLGKDYWKEIMSIDHSIIAPGHVGYSELVPPNTFYQLPDVVTFEDVVTYFDYNKNGNVSYVLRIDKNTFFEHVERISNSIHEVARLNIIISDIDTFTENDFGKYKECLDVLSKSIRRAYYKGKAPQVNLITDRMMLKEMNNCNAGYSSLTLAPDGKFYICPAFYQAYSQTPIRDIFDVGSVKHGINIKNSNLYKIGYAPLCRYCDAFQCKRCVWLNNKTTYEVNIPSHQQCVIAHLERNASRNLLESIRKDVPSFMNGITINEIKYLDPFENIIK